MALAIGTLPSSLYMLLMLQLVLLFMIGSPFIMIVNSVSAGFVADLRYLLHDALHGVENVLIAGSICTDARISAS